MSSLRGSFSHARSWTRLTACCFQIRSSAFQFLQAEVHPFVNATAGASFAQLLPVLELCCSLRRANDSGISGLDASSTLMDDPPPARRMALCAQCAGYTIHARLGYHQITSVPARRCVHRVCHAECWFALPGQNESHALIVSGRIYHRD